MRQYTGRGKVLLHKRVEVFSDGKAYLEIRPEDTEGLAVGLASYDVQATFTDLGVKTIIPPARFQLGPENTWGGEKA